MGSKEFIQLCKEKIAWYYNHNVDKTDHKSITEDDVYLVWYAKTIQNHKALLGTTVSDGMYYEMTFNGDTNELYMDAYKKREKLCIQLDFVKK